MKSLLLFILLLIPAFANAELICKNDISNEFTFKYNIINSKLQYTIFKNNKAHFSYYSDPYTQYNSEISFYFETPTKIINTDNIISPIFSTKNDDVYNSLIKFYFEDNFLFFNFLNYPSISDIVSYPIRENAFTQKSIYYNEIDLIKFIKNLEIFIPENKKEGRQKIIMKIKMIHNPDMTSCSSFITKPISLDFAKIFPKPKLLGIF